MDPRRAACRVLGALAATPRHLETVLREELERDPRADPRDRAQATNLVYAVLRHRAFLDHLLAAFLKRPLARLDLPVLLALRLGAAELTVVGAAPHAAVNGAVELVKRGATPWAAGLVNGVLRALARDGSRVPLPAAGDAADRLALEYSHPRFWVAELLGRFSEAETVAWLAADQAPRPASLRVNRLKATPTEVTAELAAAGLVAAPHPLNPDCLVLEGGRGRLFSLPGFAAGRWQPQDPGAAAVTPLLGVAPGQRVLDLCAGAGGKTGHLAALLANRGELVAVEPSPGRVRALGENLARLGAAARVLPADGRRLDPGLGLFDRVLVDAPCSGLGTLGRRPDLRWRVTPQDPPRLAVLQLELLEAAARLLKPGGALLYVTCTVTREENEAVVAALLARRPELRLAWEPPGPAEADGYFRTKPPRDACDAFFAARVVKPA